MLRRFLYLNEKALDGYLAVIEGGLADESTRRSRRTGTSSGRANLGTSAVGAGVGGARERTDDDERVVREVPEQRFDRLMAALEADPDRYAFEEVLELKESFERLKVGTMVTVECDLEIPPTIRIFSQPEQLEQMLGLMEGLAPLAAAFGQQLEGMPDPSQVQAVRSIASLIRSDVVIVGEQEEGECRVAGKLEQQYMRELPEGSAFVVGKVARRWLAGQSYPLLALPGAALMSREQRRSGASRVATGSDTDLEGPALTLDVLALYR